MLLRFAVLIIGLASVMGGVTSAAEKPNMEAKELEIVKQAKALLTSLEQELAKPNRITQYIVDQPTESADSLDSCSNPYCQAVVDGVRPWTQRERSWAKGREGYESIPNAWTFRGLGDDVYAIVWSATRAASLVRHNPVLVKNALSLVDAIAHLHTNGDFNIDRTAVDGRDPNINRFCLAPALDAWWTLRQTYPGLLPPAKR